MTDEIRALLAQMAKELDNYLQRTACDPKVVHPLATRARAAIAAHEAALLRQPAPAPVPVPVAARPWEQPGWCDAEGWCWYHHGPSVIWPPRWHWAKLGMEFSARDDGWLLPHWAIPHPTENNGTD